MTLRAILAPSRLRAVVAGAIMASVLYGASYQQFNMFRPSNLAGLNDSLSYLAMSHGVYDVNPVHRFRPVIPFLASLVQKVLHSSVKDPEERDKLSFYIINFMFSLATAILLQEILGTMGFKWEISLLGTIFFLTSRTNVMCVGAPLVDSFYFFAIAVIVYLTLRERLVLLAVLGPLLVLSKETIIPVLFLPFAKPSMRNWKMVASILAAFAVFYALRQNLTPDGAMFKSPSLLTIIHEHLPNIMASLRRLWGPPGIHDLLHGFALLILIAGAGLILDRRSCNPRIPVFLLLIVPYSFATALVSDNMGRMLFAAYVPIIAYALVGIEHFSKVTGSGISASRVA